MFSVVSSVTVHTVTFFSKSNCKFFWYIDLVQEDRMHESKGYSVAEVSAMMHSAIKETTDRGKSE